MLTFPCIHYILREGGRDGDRKRGKERQRETGGKKETERQRDRERDREEDKVLTKTSKTGGDAPLEFLDAANLIPVLACKERYANFQRLGH